MAEMAERRRARESEDSGTDEEQPQAVQAVHEMRDEEELLDGDTQREHDDIDDDDEEEEEAAMMRQMQAELLRSARGPRSVGSSVGRGMGEQAAAAVEVDDEDDDEEALLLASSADTAFAYADDGDDDDDDDAAPEAGEAHAEDEAEAEAGGVADGAPEIEADMEGTVELGDSAAWSLSSAKPGYGVERLRDGDPDTYWQSDDQLPHVLTLRWPRIVCIDSDPIRRAMCATPQQRARGEAVRAATARICVALLLDVVRDDSYCPALVSVRAATAADNMSEVQQRELVEPSGWVTWRLGGLRAYALEIAVLANHQNGKDTHVRLVSVRGPRAPAPRDQWASPSLALYAQLR
eukprot:m51a1_g5036 hypothetical protein (350) ;mRNA; r:376833-378682